VAKAKGFPGALEICSAPRLNEQLRRGVKKGTNSALKETDLFRDPNPQSPRL
jgi:hypothetical protein